MCSGWEIEVECVDWKLKGSGGCCRIGEADEVEEWRLGFWIISLLSVVRRKWSNGGCNGDRKRRLLEVGAPFVVFAWFVSFRRILTSALLVAIV